TQTSETSSEIEHLTPNTTPEDLTEYTSNDMQVDIIEEIHTPIPLESSAVENSMEVQIMEHTQGEPANVKKTMKWKRVETETIIFTPSASLDETNNDGGCNILEVKISFVLFIAVVKDGNNIFPRGFGITNSENN
ncbi:hypothetical protein HAX54_037900, partial [Datura stramonium]|nr:hypothetical protein [Datura stramonium]